MWVRISTVTPEKVRLLGIEEPPIFVFSAG
jgi:hypothetical protein